MLVAANASIFPDATSIPEQLEATAAAGFDAVELMIADDGPLGPDPIGSRCRDIVARARDLGLGILGIVGMAFWKCNYGSPLEADRQRAHDLTLKLMDLATDLHAESVLVIPAVVGHAGQPTPGVAYADALRRTGQALHRLRHEAEARGVLLAIENVWNRFLLSPIEAADLIDRVNSPNVGFCFDTGNVLPYGYPQDWISTLGGRVVRVHAKDYDLRRSGRDGFCPLGEGSVDWPATLAALRAVGYDGPLTVEGPGEPGEACRRLRKLLADGAPPASVECE